MKPRIDGTQFGSITIAGTRYDHDVLVLPGGSVRKRRKQLSKAVYGTSHTISLEEATYVYERSDGASQLIVGAGQYGRVELSPQAADYLAAKRCEVVLRPTPEALGVWNDAAGQVVGLFHVTC